MMVSGEKVSAVSISFCEKEKKLRCDRVEWLERSEGTWREPVPFQRGQIPPHSLYFSFTTHIHTGMRWGREGKVETAGMMQATGKRGTGARVRRRIANTFPRSLKNIASLQTGGGVFPQFRNLHVPAFLFTRRRTERKKDTAG